MPSVQALIANAEPIVIAVFAKGTDFEMVPLDLEDSEAAPLLRKISERGLAHCGELGLINSEPFCNCTSLELMPAFFLAAETFATALERALVAASKGDSVEWLEKLWAMPHGNA